MSGSARGEEGSLLIVAPTAIISAVSPSPSVAFKSAVASANKSKISLAPSLWAWFAAIIRAFRPLIWPLPTIASTPHTGIKSDTQRGLWPRAATIRAVSPWASKAFGSQRSSKSSTQAAAFSGSAIDPPEPCAAKCNAVPCSPTRVASLCGNRSFTHSRWPLSAARHNASGPPGFSLNRALAPWPKSAATCLASPSSAASSNSLFSRASSASEFSAFNGAEAALPASLAPEMAAGKTFNRAPHLDFSPGFADSRGFFMKVVVSRVIFARLSCSGLFKDFQRARASQRPRRPFHGFCRGFGRSAAGVSGFVFAGGRLMRRAGFLDHLAKGLLLAMRQPQRHAALGDGQREISGCPRRKRRQKIRDFPLPSRHREFKGRKVVVHGRHGSGRAQIRERGQRLRGSQITVCDRHFQSGVGAPAVRPQIGVSAAQERGEIDVIPLVGG